MDYPRYTNQPATPTTAIFGSDPEEKLFTLVQALSVAVAYDFMAREHAAKIWKKQLANSPFDLPKEKKDSE
jgi:hypothetical protein